MTPAGRHVEQLLARLGYRSVAGLDEAGMGPLAGPVVAAAVVFPQRGALPPVADSKALSADARRRLARRIRTRAVAVGVGVVGVDDIDRLNILQAGLEAMRRALAATGMAVDFAVVDGREVPALGTPQVAYPKADGFVASVAAASIIAKVERDAMMLELDRTYPVYGFAAHMGYGTPAHLSALHAYGPSPIHRRSFAPVREALGAAAE